VTNRTALVHIGTHKTGTTSFQAWARDNAAALLERRDVAVYRGYAKANPFEFALLSMRPNRSMWHKRARPEWCLDEWQDDIRRQMREQVDQPAQHLLVSSEALCLLRHDDELERLRDLLAPRTVRVVVCLREPASFLASHRHTIARRGETPSTYRDLYTYVEPDSWLVDYESLLGVYRRVFGDDQVVSFSYEEAMAQHGSTIPGVLEGLGVDPAGLPAWETYRLNPAPAHHGIAYRSARRVVRAWRAFRQA
jgi:hypothetical protein